MSATAEIRVKCDQSAKVLRDALRVYAKGNPRAPAGIQADAVLYGDLTRHYLQWSAALLTTIEEAGAARPAWKAAVDRLVEAAGAYFSDPSRWPAVAHLDDPLQLLIPAYYAVRSAQKVNWLGRPELVSVDFTEAHEFVIEILGHEVSDEICQQKNSDLKSLPQISEDPPPVAEPLHYRSFLHAAQRNRLAKARAPKPVAPPVPAAPPPPPPVAAFEKEKVVALGWSLELSDKSIVLEQTNSPPGSGFFYSRQTVLDLKRGHRFRLLETSFSRVGGGMVSGAGESRNESLGEWKIEVSGEVARLVLIGDDGSMTSYRLKKGGRNYVTLDGRDRAWKSL